jgi:hypothetical protein
MLNIQSVSKALAGALASVIVVFLARYGVVIDNEIAEAISVVAAAVIGFVIVYVSPKNKG